MRDYARWIAVMLWIVTACWLALAWYLSSQTGEDTGKLSLRIAAIICDVASLSANAVAIMNAVIRKAAHFFVYFILTGLATAAAIYTFPKHNTAWLWPLAPIALISVIDEMRKHAIPGRHSSWLEAGLNVFGCIAGTLVLWRFLAQKA